MVMMRLSVKAYLIKIQKFLILHVPNIHVYMCVRPFHLQIVPKGRPPLPTVLTPVTLAFFTFNMPSNSNFLISRVLNYA
jgi:hypothetical protein